MLLSEANDHIGSGVVYRPPTPQVWPPPAERPAEDGIITSVNSTYVFVRYAGDTGSKATLPEHLTLLSDTGS